jgi:hypothetical protein
MATLQPQKGTLKMQPCFDKLYAFMVQENACADAFAAVESASGWGNLCAHPHAGDWAEWLAARCNNLAPLLAEYEAKRALLWAEYEAKCALLQIILVSAVRAEFEPE